MKRIFLLVIISSLFISCSVGDDTIQSDYTLLKIQDFDVPTAFKVDSVSVFKVRYKRESDCQLYNGLYFNSQGGNRTKIAVKVIHLEENVCYDDSSIYEVPLNFRPSKSGVYILDFWTGEGANGEDQFSNTEIIVP